MSRLKAANVRPDPALTNAELSQTQRQLGFTFAPEHRELL